MPCDWRWPRWNIKFLQFVYSLSLAVHEVQQVIKKENGTLTFIGRGSEFKSREVLLQMYRVLLRPQQENCVQFWSPYLRKDRLALETVQRRFTRCKVECILVMENILAGCINAWYGASLGDVSKYLVDFSQPSEVTGYMELNFTSPLCLTALLLKQFPSRENFQRTVVNISSLCATKPFKSWLLYCAGKAARDMAFRVLAAEEPGVRVLNYAPGPLDTGMQERARMETRDPELRKIFETMHQQGQLLECQASVRKLMDILVRDEFESGAHIDYFDQ
ncbi:sepiapterin reductase-like [Narcine bancroftii]|uniref:sepiapterin reductase-like n=1 Tax=Narcine bancroftii TaxID=1343680 RepID=UPI003831CFF6